jgi:hypothetical protein
LSLQKNGVKGALPHPADCRVPGRARVSDVLDCIAAGVRRRPRLKPPAANIVFLSGVVHNTWTEWDLFDCFLSAYRTVIMHYWKEPGVASLLERGPNFLNPLPRLRGPGGFSPRPPPGGRRTAKLTRAVLCLFSHHLVACRVGCLLPFSSDIFWPGKPLEAIGRRTPPCPPRHCTCI